jgi:Protein of unknown function (DUF664)
MKNTSRPDPPRLAGEKETLTGFLEFLRATVLWKCEGLTAEQLGTRAVEPSKMSLHGMIRHLTDVEIGWLPQTFVDEKTPFRYSTKDRPDADWEDLDPGEYENDLRRYHETVERSREMLAALPLDHEGVDQGKPVSLRWVLTHMIEEYARHCGHADLLRERIDGETGE